LDVLLTAMLTTNPEHHTGYWVIGLVTVKKIYFVEYNNV